jgi:predicted Fe-Mo cluster-binding NifX family protein
MKIAIALFENRVSPRFDLSPKLWIIREENGEVVHQEKISLEGFTILQRIEKLNSSGITKLICGGIHDFSLNQLINMGIEVFHNVMGEADTALKNFLNGELQSGFHFEKGRTGNSNDHKIAVKTRGWEKGTRRRFCASEKNNPKGGQR